MCVDGQKGHVIMKLATLCRVGWISPNTELPKTVKIWHDSCGRADLQLSAMTSYWLQTALSQEASVSQSGALGDDECSPRQVTTVTATVESTFR